MVVRKCPKCGVVWRSELTQCAFCGHEGADQPATAVTVLERPSNGKPPRADLPPAVVAAPPPFETARFSPADAAVPPRAAPAEAPPRSAPVSPGHAEASARSADAKAGPAHAAKEAPASEAAPLVPAAKEAPHLPSANVPLVFAFLGLAAAALLPFGAWMTPGRTASVLVFLGVALLAPFAPLAWWTGGRYEESCDVLGFLPSGAARAGRGMGIAVTLLLAAEGSALAFLRALQSLQG